MFGPFQSSPPLRLGALALACSLALIGSAAHADERSDLAQLRATTMALMQALIDNGLLSKDKADDIVRQSLRAAPVNEAQAQATPSGDKPKPPVIRVPYLSESARAEIRDQVKREVLAQAHDERWGEPGALPDWLSRITVEGDVRVRFQDELFDKGNLEPDASNGYASQSGSALGWSPDLINTRTNRDRMTLRARVGVRSDLGDGVSAGVRLTTGSTTSAGALSTSQTLGNSLNKYTISLDKAYIKYEGENGLQGSAGRFANPFFGTDLTWPDDLNFDGVAMSYKPKLNKDSALFMTAGAFPLREFEISTHDKWLYGAQIGGAFAPDSKTRLRLGLAAYSFVGIEGRPSSDPAPAGLSANVAPYSATLSEYPAAVRQKGNTLFRVNQDPLTPNEATKWGLASKFTPINLSAEANFTQFDPVNVKLSLDFVKNIGFDIDEIRRRTGLINQDGSPVDIAKQNAAYQIKLTVGADQLDRAGQWQSFLTLRRLERDAWVDAFTDTTWHLGGTNYQGWSLGGQYGVAPRTTLGLRWTSTRSLPDSTLYQDSATGDYTTGLSNYPLKIDVLQLELNTRF